MSFYGKPRTRRVRNGSTASAGVRVIGEMLSASEHLREPDTEVEERLRAEILDAMPEVADSLPARGGEAPVAAAPFAGPASVAPAASPAVSPRRAAPEVNPWLAAGLGVVITGAIIFLSWSVAGGTFLVGLLGGMADADAGWLLLATPAVLGAGFAALPVGPFVATTTGGTRPGLASIGLSAVLIALAPVALRRYGLGADLIGHLFRFSIVAALVFAAAALPGVMIAARLRGRAPRHTTPVADVTGTPLMPGVPERVIQRRAPKPSVPPAERRAVYCDECGASNVPGRQRCLMCDAWLRDRM